MCICQMTDAFGHLAYDLFADGAVAGYRIAADVYEVLLGIEAVSHYAAFEIGRGTRHGREACRDGTARAAFRRGKGLDTVLQYKRQVLDGAQNEYAEAIQRVRQQERRLREAEARHRSLNQQFRRAEAEGITIADAMGYEMGLRMLEGEIQREESRLHQLQTEAEERRKRMIAARQDTSSLEKLREKKLESYEKELQRQEELRIDELVANTRAVEAGLL